MSETIGGVLRMLRKEQDVTQEQLANALHISNQSVSKWETGQANPDITMIPAIANFFKVSVDTLFAFGREAPYDEYQESLERQRQTGDLEAAIALWGELNRRYPNDYRVQKELVCALCAKGDGEAFDRIFRHVVDILRNNLNPAIERELLQALKSYLRGNLWASSRPFVPAGQGKPLSQQEADALWAKNPGRTKRAKGKRVLIVDDAPFMRKVLGEILRRGGYDVVGEAASGHEAVQAADQLAFDVAVMDVVMPEMDGLDATEKILAAQPDVCIVMCTALAYRDVLRRARAVGALAFVVKPFQQEQLLGALRQIEPDEAG